MTQVLPAPGRPVASFAWLVADAAVVAKRNLLRIPRVPQILLFATVQPIMFVLLFSYVFGGAITLPAHEPYRQFLLAGVFAQALSFGTGSTSVAMAQDLQKGLIDRFRSLPMARSAVAAGHTIGDLVYNAFILVIMSAVGLAIGWRTHRGAGYILAGYGLLLLFGFAMSWIGALIGMSASTPAVASNAGFAWLFPLTFISNAFVPLQTLPGWLQPVAEWSPFSAVVAGARVLFGNSDPVGAGSALPTQHPVLTSLGWSAAMIAVCVPLAVRAYGRAASRH
jgi:ABC-2 type transport system permease protein